MHGAIKDYTADPQCLDIINAIKTSNAELKTFKGIGSVKLSNNDQNSSFRLAWAGEPPYNLRLIVLMSGKTIETFAANGKRIFLKSHTGAHQFIKKTSKNASLEKLISIPVKTNDIISLLSGKIPLAQHKYSRLIKVPDNKSYILELSKPWWGVVERVFLNNEKKPTGFEMIKGGDSIYRVSLDRYKKINGFNLPFEILIESEKATCKIIYTNYFTNPDVNPNFFTLKPD